eukprot:9132102-Karenia_brevis.AAC.1
MVMTMMILMMMIVVVVVMVIMMVMAMVMVMVTLHIRPCGHWPMRILCGNPAGAGRGGHAHEILCDHHWH